MSRSSFRLFGLQATTEEVVHKAQNNIYDQILRVETDIEKLKQRENNLIAKGRTVKDKATFNEISLELKQVRTRIAGLKTRIKVLNRQLEPLDKAKDRKADLETARTIVTANKRVLGDIGKASDILDLQRQMEHSTLAMEDGPASILDEMFEPSEGVSEEELDEADLRELWGESRPASPDMTADLQARYDRLTTTPSSSYVSTLLASAGPQR